MEKNKKEPIKTENPTGFSVITAPPKSPDIWKPKNAAIGNNEFLNICLV